MKKLIASTKTVLYNLRELFKLWFGLKLILVPNLSTIKNRDKSYDLGYVIMWKFKFITFCQWFFCNHRLFAKTECKNTQNALRKLKKRHGKGSEEYLPVDEVMPDIDPDVFYEKYVINPRPVVIRGLAKNCAAMQKWNHDFFLRNYGDTKLYMNKIKYGTKIKVKEWMGELSEVLTNEGVYVDNCKVLFTRHRELQDDIAIVPKWGKFLKKSIYLFPQIFLGYTKGAPFHCANAWNFFIMVDGSKQWTFISPEQSLQVGALINPSAIYADACVTGKGETWRDEFELYKRYCPKYRTVVEKGDVLLNPPWWWHEIQNLNPFTIAVATRWFVFNHRKTNSLFDFVQFMSNKMWQVNYHGFLNQGGLGLGDAEDDDIIRKFVANRNTISRYERDYEVRCWNKANLINTES